MKKTCLLFTVLMILLLACSPGDKATETPEESGITAVSFADMTIADAVSLAKEQNKIVMVDFFSDT